MIGKIVINGTELQGEVLEEVSSTQSYLKESRLRNTTETLQWVFAHKQLHGRGRQGASWESGVGNIQGSFCVEKQKIPPHVPPTWIGMKLALAVVDWFNESLGDSRFKIKWPNDIYFNEKKIAGIIAEQTSNGEVLLGLGLNCVPVSVTGATSLQELGLNTKELNPEGMFFEIIEKFFIELPKLDYEARYLENSYFKVGDEISWLDANGVLAKGKFIGLGPLGEMKVFMEQGSGAAQSVPEKSLYSEAVSRIRAG